MKVCVGVFGEIVAVRTSPNKIILGDTSRPLGISSPAMMNDVRWTEDENQWWVGKLGLRTKPSHAYWAMGGPNSPFGGPIKDERHNGGPFTDVSEMGTKPNLSVSGTIAWRWQMAPISYVSEDAAKKNLNGIGITWRCKGLVGVHFKQPSLQDYWQPMSVETSSFIGLTCTVKPLRFFLLLPTWASYLDLEVVDEEQDNALVYLALPLCVWFKWGLSLTFHVSVLQ